jgi:hypothetical protein
MWCMQTQNEVSQVSLKSTQMWKIHRGTDDGDKPEKVYKYDDRDGLSVLDSSQESSPRPVRVSDVTPPPGVLDVCTPILVLCVW